MVALAGTVTKNGSRPPGTSPEAPVTPCTSPAPLPMKEYLISGSPSPAQATEPDPSSLSPQPPKMTDSSLTAPDSHTAHTASLSLPTEDEQCTKMAQAVVALLSPTISAAVDRTVTAGIDHL